MTFQSAASQPTSRTLRGEEEGDSKDGVGAGEANEGMTGAGSGNDGLEMKNLRPLSLLFSRFFLVLWRLFLLLSLIFLI